MASSSDPSDDTSNVDPDKVDVGASVGFGMSMVIKTIKLKFPKAKTITTSKLSYWLKPSSDTDVILLDCRPKEEYDISHIENSTQVDWQSDDMAELVKNIPNLNQTGKTGKEIHGELADVNWSSAPSYAQDQFWVVDSNAVERLQKVKPDLDAHWMPPTKKCVIMIVPDLVYSDGRIQVEEIAQALGISHGGVSTILHDRLETGSKQKAVVCYCSVGYRSSAVDQKLQDYLQFRDGSAAPPVYNLEGSLFQWANEGRPMIDSTSKKTVVAHPYSSIWGKLLNKELRKGNL